MISTRRMSPLMEITFIVVTFLFSILAAKGIYTITQFSMQDNATMFGISYPTFNSLIALLFLFSCCFCYIKIIKGMGTKRSGITFILVIFGFMIIMPTATLSTIGVFGKQSITNALEQEVATLAQKANGNVKAMNKSRSYFDDVRSDLKGDIIKTHTSAIENIKQLYLIIDRTNVNQWNSFKPLASLINFYVFIPLTLILIVLFYKAIKEGKPKGQKIHGSGFSIS